VASAQVSGVLRLFRYQLSDTLACTAVASKTITSDGSCRGVCFSADGASLYAGTSDCALHSIDCETTTLTAIDMEAHNVGINRVRSFEVNSVCTGDDSGNLKVWDTRSKGVVYQYKKHTDFITDIALHSSSSSLVVTSGDGTLSVGAAGRVACIAASVMLQTASYGSCDVCFGVLHTPVDHVDESTV
jgi:WD40 repeat protein